MKKFSVFLCVMALIFIASGDLLASSVDYNTNQGAEWARNVSRNAVNDTADAVFYNPAGTALLADGLWVQAGNQTVIKEYTMEIKAGSKEFKDEEPAWIVPNLFGVYKTGQLAAFAGFTPVGGGGTVKYKDGIPMMVGSAVYIPMALAANGVTGATNATFTGGNLEASSMYLGGTLGCSYQIDKMISVSAAGRYVNATKTYKGEANYLITGSILNGSIYKLELDAEDKAQGFGGIIGVNVKPTSELNIGLRYETETKMEFKTSVKNNKNFGGKFKDGEKSKKNIPAMLGLGVSYLVMPDLTVSVGGDYYFIKQADQKDGVDALGQTDVKGYDDDYKNGWEAQIGCDYRLTPELLVSLSYQYVDAGGSDKTYNDFDMTLDAHTVGFGGKYNVSKELDFSLGFLYVPYIAGEDKDKTVEYNKTAYVVGLAVNYKAM